MDADERKKLDEIEANAKLGIFSERDICALVSTFRERNAALAAMTARAETAEAKLAEYSDLVCQRDAATQHDWLAKFSKEAQP